MEFASGWQPDLSALAQGMILIVHPVQSFDPFELHLTLRGHIHKYILKQVNLYKFENIFVDSVSSYIITLYAIW